MRIEDALAKFITQLEADGRSQHTLGQYRRHIGGLAAWLARERPDVELEQLDHEDVAAFMNSPAARQRPDGVAKRPNTANALRTSLRVFFSYLHAAGMIASNPARLLRRAICSPGPPRTMSDDEVVRLLGALKSAKGQAARRDYLLIHLLLSTGIRLSSALQLRVEDIDLERRELVLHGCKGNRNETIVIGTAIGNHLATFLGNRRHGCLFAGSTAAPICRRHAARRFQMWLTAIGIARRLAPHSCRHSFAMSLYRRTRDVLVVQQALQHRSIMSSMVYAHATSDELRQVLR